MSRYRRPEEDEWIAHAQEGDETAFASLVEAYQMPVFNLCYRLLGDRPEAEDAAQETFLRAHRSIRKYDVKRRFINWLLAIASNHCIDRLRKRRFSLVSLETEQPMLSGESDPEAVFVETETTAKIHRLLARLSPKDRAAVVLFYWYELTLKEIGATLKMSESAVKTRLHRARRSLAEAWLEDETSLTRLEVA